MTAPSVLVLDLGGVTCRWLPDRRLVALAELSGQPPGLVDQLVFESGFDDAGERGRFGAEEFTVRLAELLGLPVDEATSDGLRAAWALAYEPEPAVLRVLGRLDGRRALFTNNGPLTEAALGAELAEVGAAFDQVLLSWRLGAAKPDPEGFAAATDALGVQPGDVLFVDDSEANVDGARVAGWHAHRFTTVLDLQAAVQALRP